MNDFSTPRRMSPAAFIVIWMQTFQQLITTFIFIIGMMLFDDDLVHSQRIIMALACVGGAVALSAGIAFLKYYFRKYHIEGDSLIYTHGLAFKNTTSVPLERIHNLRTKSGIFYRMVDMRGVSFDTLASDKQEVELILNESEWQALLRQVRIGEDFPDAGGLALPAKEKLEVAFRDACAARALIPSELQDHGLALILLGKLLHDDAAHALGNAQLLKLRVVKIHKLLYIHHAVGEHAHGLVLVLEEDGDNAGVGDLAGLIAGDDLARLGENLAGEGVSHSLGKLKARNAGEEVKLLVELVAAHI